MAIATEPSPSPLLSRPRFRRVLRSGAGGSRGWPGEVESVGRGPRQVFDLPSASHVEVTEHQADPRQCAGRRRLRRAVFPDVVRSPTQSGHRGVPPVPALTTLDPLGESVRETARSPDLRGRAGRRDARSGGTLADRTQRLRDLLLRRGISLILVSVELFRP